MKQEQVENERLLIKEERTACVPTTEELASYLATPDDAVAQKLRENLPPELFEKLGFIMLYTENMEKAQDAKTLTLVVAATLKKVGRGLSALGYYEKPEDFLLELEEYFVSHPEEEQVK